MIARYDKLVKYTESTDVSTDSLNRTEMGITRPAGAKK